MALEDPRRLPSKGQTGHPSNSLFKGVHKPNGRSPFVSLELGLGVAPAERADPVSEVVPL